MKIARDRKSAVLASNAVHHRVDSLTSIVALATIGGAHIFTNASWLDPVGGLIISAMVVKAGWNNTLTSLLELADVTVDDGVKSAVRRTATKAVKGDDGKGVPPLPGAELIEIKDIQGIKSGQNYLMDVEVVVPGGWTIERTREIEDAIRARAGAKVRGLRRLRVRFTSQEHVEGNFTDEFIGSDVSPRSSPEPDDEHDHEQERVNNHGRNNHSVKKLEKTK